MLLTCMEHNITPKGRNGEEGETAGNNFLLDTLCFSVLHYKLLALRIWHTFSALRTLRLFLTRHVLCGAMDLKHN